MAEVQTEDDAKETQRRMEAELARLDRSWWELHRKIQSLPEDGSRSDLVIGLRQAQKEIERQKAKVSAALARAMAGLPDPEPASPKPAAPAPSRSAPNYGRMAKAILHTLTETKEDDPADVAESHREVRSLFDKMVDGGIEPLFSFILALHYRRGDRIAKLEERIAELEARPAMKYCGTYDYGRQYSAGEMCTMQGSMWACIQTTSDRPGEGSKAWQLAVKRGRDGKDAK